MTLRELKELFEDVIKEHKIELQENYGQGSGASRNWAGIEVVDIDLADRTDCPVATTAHEIGHVALGHTAYSPAKVTCKFFIEAERDAWLYAEELLRKKQKPLNYEWAEWCFQSHLNILNWKSITRSEPFDHTISIPWRYKP